MKWGLSKSCAGTWDAEYSMFYRLICFSRTSERPQAPPTMSGNVNCRPLNKSSRWRNTRPSSCKANCIYVFVVTRRQKYNARWEQALMTPRKEQHELLRHCTPNSSRAVKTARELLRHWNKWEQSMLHCISSTWWNLLDMTKQGLYNPRSTYKLSSHPDQLVLAAFATGAASFRFKNSRTSDGSILLNFLCKSRSRRRSFLMLFRISRRWKVTAFSCSLSFSKSVLSKTEGDAKAAKATETDSAAITMSQQCFPLEPYYSIALTVNSEEQCSTNTSSVEAPYYSIALTVTIEEQCSTSQFENIFCIFEMDFGFCRQSGRYQVAFTAASAQPDKSMCFSTRAAPHMRSSWHD